MPTLVYGVDNVVFVWFFRYVGLRLVFRLVVGG